MLSFCLFVFPLMGRAEWGGNPVCWWLGLYFCFVCCLDEVSCTGCYWWLGDAGSCIQVVYLVCVLTIWYSHRGAWCAAVHGVARSRTRLSNFTFTFHFHALEKKMAPHSSTLAWRISGMWEPGGLPSLGSHRVRHDWSDLAAAALVLREGNGTPLQYSCLENPMDGGAW